MPIKEVDGEYVHDIWVKTQVPRKENIKVHNSFNAIREEDEQIMDKAEEEVRIRASRKLNMVQGSKAVFGRLV
jgi:hypothetical protein